MAEHIRQFVPPNVCTVLLWRCHSCTSGMSVVCNCWDWPAAGFATGGDRYVNSDPCLRTFSLLPPSEIYDGPPLPSGAELDSDHILSVNESRFWKFKALLPGYSMYTGPKPARASSTPSFHTCLSANYLLQTCLHSKFNCLRFLRHLT